MENKEKEAPKKPINVSLTIPNGEKARFTLNEMTPFQFNFHLGTIPAMNWFTNYSLKTKKGTTISFSEKLDLSSELDKNTLEATVEILPWTPKAIFQHAQHFARIMFTLTERSNYSDCEQSLVSWIGRTFGSVSKNLPNEADYGGILPMNFLKNDQPLMIEHFDIDLEATMNDKSGFYNFTLTTHENEKFAVKSGPKGFFIEEGKFFNSLHDLVASKSNYFAENEGFIAIKWNNLNSIERKPFSPLDKKTIFTTNTKKDVETLELFQRPTEQIQGSLRDLLKREEFSKGSLEMINEIENFYLRMVFDGIKKIANGEIQTSFEGSRTYLYHGIVISTIDEYSGLYANNDETVREISSFAIRALDYQRSDPSVEIDRPIVIDYLGQRYVVIYNDIDCVLGYGPEHDEFKKDDRFNEFIGKLKESYCFESIPKFTRGFIAADGKPILTHLGRLTPRDYNYPDPEKHAGYRIRGELIRPFEIHKELHAHADELKELGGLPDYEYTNPNLNDEEKLKKLSERRSDIIYKAPALSYDLDALTINAESETPENIKELALYLEEVAIPKFIDSFVDVSPCTIDSTKLSAQLHKNGINIRYLGKLISRFDSSIALHQSIIQTFEVEMIIRSIKYLAREERWNLEQILNVIKTITTQGDGFDQLFEKICEISLIKFSGKPNKPSPLMAPFLKRSLLLLFGIVLGLRDGELPLELSNIMDIKPRIRFQYTQNFDVNAHVQFAINLFNANNVRNSYQILHSSAQIIESTMSPFNPNLVDCYFYLGLIYFQEKQFDQAYESLLHSVIIQERYSDDTDPEVIFKLTMLGMISVASKNQRRAFAFYARAAAATKLLSPFHTWTIRTSADASSSISSIDGNLAIQFAQNSIDFCKQLNGSPLMLAHAYIKAANVALDAEKINVATKFADEAAKYTQGEELNRVRNLIQQKQQKHSGSRKNRGGR